MVLGGGGGLVVKGGRRGVFGFRVRVKFKSRISWKSCPASALDAAIQGGRGHRMQPNWGLTLAPRTRSPSSTRLS